MNLKHKFPEFALLALTVLAEYKIEDKRHKPMLRIDLKDDIYFYHQGEKIVLDSRDRDMFLREQTGRRRFDYHYEVKI